MTVKQKAEKLFKNVNTFILSCIGTDGYPVQSNKNIAHSSKSCRRLGS